jgi:glucose-6-phosphate isomerase
MPIPSVELFLYNHHTDGHYEKMRRDRLLERARKLVERVRKTGLRSLRASSDPLVAIGMELDAANRPVKSLLGVLDLSWQAARRPEWPVMIQSEIDAIRAGIREAHGAELRNLIWAGMGGSAEDKAMYNALGLLDGGVRVYILDSTDPAKLQAILDAIAPRGASTAQALRETLVAGMALGMTSYEPVLNLEKLHLLYEKHKVPSASNFLYMGLPGSLLDRFARPRKFRHVELQPDNGNSVAGRHSGPLTRGSLYPLALNGVDLEAWIAAAVLSEEEIQDAFRMAAFLHGNGIERRDKVMLLLPREWQGAGIWTKQDFEESLGKSEELGIKIFPNAAACPDRYLPPRRESRVFWAVNVFDCDNPDPAAVKRLRDAGYPVAALNLKHAMPLPKYMQWVHYVVFGMAWLRKMNFVTQPGVELYKQIANRLYRRAQKLKRIEETAEWRALARSRHRARAAGGIVLYYDSLVAAGFLKPGELGGPRSNAAGVFSRAVQKLWAEQKIEYAELTFYGDTRYRAEGRRLRELLESAAAGVFAGRLGICTDVYEGPAMNHSYHEMIIGHGRCFSVVILSRRQASIPIIQYRAEYHKAQWLATKLALEQRGRAVVALTLPDLGPASLSALGSFFEQTARLLASGPGETR